MTWLPSGSPPNDFQTGVVSGTPFAVGAVAMFFWARHDDRSGERLWHVVGPLARAGVNTIGATSGLIGPYLTGWLLDATGSSQIAMLIVGLLLLLGALLLIFVFKNMAKTPEMKGTTLG
ncbi:LPXTG cell wall anchor domain-containing protein [Arthrobacter sp. efr-133-TYG-104]|uniref:LPXTG cell wall anchor domain-containing protein n=1 Tax=Arthrobacter sp. efr-133-TYG-104 TaxID=3040324 RepID=UPI0025513904|nr:LPXTG cell wall anchor domain-containing protein [Arthrobacter sp. efr-133-TYG-104]